MITPKTISMGNEASDQEQRSCGVDGMKVYELAPYLSFTKRTNRQIQRGHKPGRNTKEEQGKSGNGNPRYWTGL